MRQVFERRRTREQETLARHAAQVEQRRRLRFVLDAFGHGLEAERRA
jgi:hypothetical protein